MSGQPPRLYGTVGAETLYREVVEIYEREIEPNYPLGSKVKVEEWTVIDNRRLMPLPDWVIDDIVEHLGYKATILARPRMRSRSLLTRP